MCEDEDEIDEYEEENGVETKDSIHLNHVDVSLKSVIGLTSGQKIKLMGGIGDHEVLVLSDCGDTHNFVYKRMVNALGLKFTATRDFTIILGTGRTNKSAGVCWGLVLSLQDTQVCADFLPLNLGHTDVIMGRYRHYPK